MSGPRGQVSNWARPNERLTFGPIYPSPVHTPSQSENVAFQFYSSANIRLISIAAVAIASAAAAVSRMLEIDASTDARL